MKKLITFFILGAILLLLNPAFGQLSDRINNPTTFKTGTRPIAGNMGLIIGANIDDLANSFGAKDATTFYQKLPAVYLSYYQKDNFAYRIGIYTWRKSTVIKGSLDPLLNGGVNDADYSNKTFQFLINPGVEKHFGSSNILDVYVGAGVPLGFVNEVKNNTANTTTVKNINETSRLNIVLGISGYVGVRAFIADLPLALGVEFAQQGRTYLRNKTKHVVTTGATTQTYYTADDDDGTNYGFFKSLKSRKSEVKTTVSVSICYYFNR